MKGKNLTIISIFAIVVGIILIIANRSINSAGVVVTGGILFILAGVLNIIIFDTERHSDRKGRGAFASTFSLLASIGTVVLGVCMLIFKSTFMLLVPYMFGIIIGCLAIYQFFLLALGFRPVIMPGWMYLVPTALLGAAIYVFFCKPEYNDNIIMLTTGISLCVFGLCTAIEIIIAAHTAHKASRGNIDEAQTSYKPVPLDDSDSENTPSDLTKN